MAKEGYIVRLPNYIRKNSFYFVALLISFCFFVSLQFTPFGFIFYSIFVGAIAAVAAANTLRMYVTKINPSRFAFCLLDFSPTAHSFALINRNEKFSIVPFLIGDLCLSLKCDSSNLDNPSYHKH